MKVGTLRPLCPFDVKEINDVGVEKQVYPTRNNRFHYMSSSYNKGKWRNELLRVLQDGCCAVLCSDRPHEGSLNR